MQATFAPNFPAFGNLPSAPVARRTSTRPYAKLAGSRADPKLSLHVYGKALVPGTATTYLDWTRALPGRTFDMDEKTWYITGFGLGVSDPVAFLDQAGLDVIPGGPEVDYGIDDLAELVRPIVQLERRGVRIHPRLCGRFSIADVVGIGATWDKKSQTLLVPFVDILNMDGYVRPGIPWPQEAIDQAVAARSRVTTKPQYAAFAAHCASSAHLTAEDEASLDDWFKLLPEWFTIDLFGYQKYGSLAVALGHSLLADEPGVGKCVIAETELAVNGSLRQIGDLWSERAGRAEPEPDGFGETISLVDGELVVPTIGSSGDAEERSASRIYRQRYRGEMLTLRSASGHQLTSSPAHKIYTPSGWVRADEIAVGDLVGVAMERLTDSRPANSFEMALSRVLAWHIGEGHEFRASTSIIANTDRNRMDQLVQDYAEVFSALGLPMSEAPSKVVPIGRRQEHYRDQFIIRVNSKSWSRWLESNGMVHGHQSSDRFIPDVIMEGPSEAGAEFVRHLFAAEGSVRLDGLVEISSASPKLISDLRELMARAGVLLAVHQRKKRLQSGEAREYVFGTVSGSQIELFAERFGVADGEKSDRLKSSLRDRSSSTHDIIPVADVLNWFIEQGVPARRLGVSPGHVGGSGKGLTRKRAELVLRKVQEIVSGDLAEAVSDGPADRWSNGTLDALRSIDVKEATQMMRLLEKRMSKSIRWSAVQKLSASNFDGYIYDLTVPVTHNYVANGLWTHNTFQALAAAAIRGSKRTLVVAPPLMLLGWRRDAEKVGLHNHGGAFEGESIALVGSSKKVQQPPENGVYIVADSTLAARPQLVETLREWAPDVMIYDEAHRGMTIGAKRAEAVLDVSAVSKFSIPVTGTPMFASPHQMVTLLEMSGHLAPVFGGRDAFLSTYCTQDKYGSFRPNRRNLNRLHERLRDHVWTRRLKRDVLPDLPYKIRQEIPVQVPLKEYHEAHADIEESINTWLSSEVVSVLMLLDRPQREQALKDMVGEFSQNGLGFVSKLREAAGKCKVPSAVELLGMHDFAINVDGKVDRPIIVWAHHKGTVAALAEASRLALAKASKSSGSSVTVEVIDGGTSPANRHRIVDAFQAGDVGVLVGSITAAGVGITLTRSQDMLFVETDWTPGVVTQTEDRCVLEGQLVHTRRGPVPIEDVTVGELVLTHEGNWRAVTDKWSNDAVTHGKHGVALRRIIAEVRHGLDDEPLSVTHDHELLVRSNGEPRWTWAAEVAPGDEVLNPADGSWRPVGQVLMRLAVEGERVWDLTVDGDESYVVGGVAVHNCNRIGSTQNVQINTLVAQGTLDPAIQTVLQKKGMVLGAVTGGDVQVSVSNEEVSVTDIVRQIVTDCVAKHAEVQSALIA